MTPLVVWLVLFRRVPLLFRPFVMFLLLLLKGRWRRNFPVMMVVALLSWHPGVVVEIRRCQTFCFQEITCFMFVDALHG